MRIAQNMYGMIANFDYLRTSVFNYSCRAYILKPGEKALVMKGFACYYMDEHGGGS